MNHFRIAPFLAIFLLWSCEDYGQLKKIQHLPATVKEVSGMEKFPNSDLIWMINDSGNKNILYGLKPGNSTLKTIEITNAENIDWEAQAKDTSWNLYTRLLYSSDAANDPFRTHLVRGGLLKQLSLP